MRADLAHALASAYLAGRWHERGLVASAARVVGQRPPWLLPLARQVLERYPAAPADRPRELAGVVLSLEAAAPAGRTRPVVRPVVATRMVTNPWHLTLLDDVAALAALLRVTPGELAWFADPRNMARESSLAPLQHYRVTTRTSASGATRVLEAPKPRLRTAQRTLLRRVVAGIPLHEACHGFRPGRSVATFAAPHAGRPILLRLDLEGFFASITVGRVYGIFRTAGYPEAVAHLLAGLTTTVLPRHAWAAVPKPSDPGLLQPHWRLGRHLAAPHLPQGAPTSPALTNLAAFRLDLRLAALAEAWGGRYTRYADDLALSGGRGWGRGTSRLLDAVGEIVREEGFRLHERKTAVLPRAGRQAMVGLVVNDRPHVGRAEVDRLRAILHNCARFGPSTQDRDGHLDFRAHLVGRVAWVAQHDPARGEKLRGQLAAIDWER